MNMIDLWYTCEIYWSFDWWYKRRDIIIMLSAELWFEAYRISRSQNSRGNMMISSNSELPLFIRIVMPIESLTQLIILRGNRYYFHLRYIITNKKILLWQSASELSYISLNYWFESDIWSRINNLQSSFVKPLIFNYFNNTATHYDEVLDNI